MSPEAVQPLFPDVPPRQRLRRDSRRMRVATLTRLRWLSAAGQLAACVFVAWGMWFPYPVGACFALIALSVAVNLALTFRLPKGHRLSARTASLILAFDIVQPAGLMYLTGGIVNPFAVFLVLPAIVAAATQPARYVVALSLLAILSASVLALAHLPLPWDNGEPFHLPGTYLGGLWFAIATTIVFCAFYVYHVAAEARLLAEALGATELVLEREQQLSSLDGLAAAAAHELGTPLGTITVVAKEMARAIPPGDPRREDVDLLLTQSERCRDILRRLTSLSPTGDGFESCVPASVLIQEAVTPHLGAAIPIRARTGKRLGPEPGLWRRTGIVQGLGNVVENAVDFARREVSVLVSWDEESLRVLVQDDGPGFAPETLAHIGEPYVSRRQRKAGEPEGNLGLGLFIARTLLERSGATLRFGNRADRQGAEAEIAWPRSALPALRPTAAPAGPEAAEADRGDPEALPAE